MFIRWHQRNNSYISIENSNPVKNPPDPSDWITISYKIFFFLSPTFSRSHASIDNWNYCPYLDVDPQVLEIQRQNLITQKILQRYLERRLHPERKPQIHVPSVDEILPKSPPPGSVRDVRQQNTTLSGNPLLRSTASGSRYSLFNDYNSKQYDSLDGDEESIQQQQRQQGLIGEDYDDSEGDLEQYEDLGGSLDNDHIDIESLQSGESEHVDSFYRDKSYRQRGNYFPMLTSFVSHLFGHY